VAKRNITAAGARGRRDGFDGYAPRDTDAEYLVGHASGVEDRKAASARVTAAVARMDKAAGRTKSPAFMGSDVDSAA
jgi:hypothetical protein